MARNYEKASDIMYSLGNRQKALNLLTKAQKLSAKTSNEQYTQKLSEKLETFVKIS